MLGSRLIGRIITALLLAAALAACNALKLAYSQGTALAYWWVDGYVNLTDEQKPKVRQTIDQWFAWHRAEQLPEIAALLRRAQAQALEPATPTQLCEWLAEGRQRTAVALTHAVPAVTELARTLQPAQLQHLEAKFRKTNKEFRDDNLQSDRAARQRAALKRVRDRVGMMYGRLDRAQQEWLAANVAASPYDPDRWYAERLARQQDILQTLRNVSSSPHMPRPQAQALIGGLAERLLTSPRPEQRAYMDKLAEYNCLLVAQLHNGATPAQRRHARDKFKGWENDVRALMGQHGAGLP